MIIALIVVTSPHRNAPSGFAVRGSSIHRDAATESRFTAVVGNPSQNGMPEIGTPSILWGVLWEDEDLLVRLTPAAGIEELNRLRAEVEGLFPKSSRKIPTNAGVTSSLNLAICCGEY